MRYEQEEALRALPQPGLQPGGLASKTATAAGSNSPLVDYGLLRKAIDDQAKTARLSLIPDTTPQPSDKQFLLRVIELLRRGRDIETAEFTTGSEDAARTLDKWDPVLRDAIERARKAGATEHEIHDPA
jgi:hypothetical protein